jgi:hypothetical protein
MAILLECINLVIPIEVLDSCEAIGGFRGFLRDQAEMIGRMVWYDEHLCRVDGAMNPADVRAMIEVWERRGLRGRVEQAGKVVWQDYCVLDGYTGMRGRCPWLRIDLSVGYAWHAKHPPGQAVGPFRWDENAG